MSTSFVGTLVNVLADEHGRLVTRFIDELGAKLGLQGAEEALGNNVVPVSTTLTACLSVSWTEA